jgi:hypothetical protein
VGSLLVGLVIGLDLAGAFAGVPRAARVLRGVAALLLFVIVAGVAWRPAFDGYDSDLWTYLLITERVADGQDVLRLDHFVLEPPASPHVSLVWLLLGWARRLTGLSGLVMVHVLGIVSAAFLTYAAWRLASRLFPAALRWPAVVLFWLSLPETWGAVALGRYLSLGFVLLVVVTLLRPPGSAGGGFPGGRLPAALWIALAFYTHLFGGVLALGAAALVWAAGRGEAGSPRLRELSVVAVLGLLLSLPCLLYSLQTFGMRKSAAHLWRPDQIEVGTFRMLSPASLPDLVSWGVLGLALVGLLAPAPVGLALARRLARFGSVLAVLLLFTPLYQVGASVLGGWMMARVVFLALPWIAATAGLAWLTAAPARWPSRLAATALCVFAAHHAVFREASEWADRRFEFRAEAQAEARALREALHGRLYLSLDMIGYATATPTLGRPLAVPPGQASPFGDFPRRQRRAHRALATNTPECWRALLELYPDLAYLLTPGPEARVERSLWGERLGGVEPEAVREVLGGMGALVPVKAGKYFVLDALRALPAGSGPPSRRGMGEGDRCE